ncbi:MAG: tetratricopeptide repeat protein [Myxococcales bacterium]|nr:tetratricopeptide repeat protein [Myxococcales bacterium]
MRRNTVERHVERGSRQLEKGSFRRALEEFHAVVQRDPDDARTWLRIAELQTRLGDGRDAVESYRNAAAIHVRKGFLRHALALYKNVLALVPDDLDALRNVAELSGQLGLMSDATLQYESLLKVCQLQARSDEALHALRCILKLNPSDVRIQMRFAETAMALGHKDEALEKLRSAAKLLKKAGRIDEYLRVCEQVLKEEPGNTQLAREIAKGYLVRGNGRFALARLRMCYDEAPKDAEILDLMAQAFDLIGKKDKAAVLLKALGRVHRDQGRMFEALDTFHRALDLAPLDQELQGILEQLESRSKTPIDFAVDVESDDVAIDMDVDVQMEARPDPAAPSIVVTEEETLKMYMPSFVTSTELEAVDPPAPDATFDLFPVQQAKKLSSDISFLIEKTATKLRRLVALLPMQMEARSRLEAAGEALRPGSPLVNELSTLGEELQSNEWIDELGSREVAEG